MTEDSVANIEVCFEHRSVDASVTTTRGVLKLRRGLLSDRRPAFIRTKSKLNTKSPLPWGWGAGQSPRLRLLTDLRPSHSGIFFRSRDFRKGFWSFQAKPAAGQPKKQSHFNGRLQRTTAVSRPRLVYFPIYFHPPGGGRKSGRFRSDTGGLATKTFARVS
jgi:hypothetical protein